MTMKLANGQTAVAYVQQQIADGNPMDHGAHVRAWVREQLKSK